MIWPIKDGNIGGGKVYEIEIIIDNIISGYMRHIFLTADE
jgi:hypothetical protein